MVLRWSRNKALDPPEPKNEAYAESIADKSYGWYRDAAIRSRRTYKVAECALMIVTAGIPLSALTLPETPVVAAVLGSVALVIGGFRSVFHWQENYVRFSRAREMVEAERRRFHGRISPYDGEAEQNKQELIRAVTQIEQEEMGQWIRIATARPRGENSEARESA